MRRTAVIVSAALLAGCASSNVALLNDPGGGSGTVAVLDPDTGKEVGALTAAGTRARVGGREVRPRPVKSRTFERLLAWMPHPPRVYVLYFQQGATEPTPESTPVLDALRAVVNPDSDVQIVGHSDTTGTDEVNDTLSLERAVQVRATLVRLGLPVETARVAGRGERELRVQTDDEVAEPANRRVEVILR